MKVSFSRGPQLNTRGDSLITVMISMGIMGVFLVGAMAAYNNMVKGQRTIASKGDVEDLKNTLRLALSSGTTCKDNMAPISVPLPVASPSIPIASFKYPLPGGGGLSTNPIIEKDKTYDGVKLTSMMLKDLVFVGGSDYVGKIAMVFDFGADASGVSKIYGGQTVTRTIPIKVTLDTTTGAVTNCGVVPDVVATVTPAPAPPGSGGPPPHPPGSCPPAVIPNVQIPSAWYAWDAVKIDYEGYPTEMASSGACQWAGIWAPCSGSTDFKLQCLAGSWKDVGVGVADGGG